MAYKQTLWDTSTERATTSMKQCGDSIIYTYAHSGVRVDSSPYNGIFWAKDYKITIMQLQQYGSAGIHGPCGSMTFSLQSDEMVEITLDLSTVPRHKSLPKVSECQPLEKLVLRE